MSSYSATILWKRRSARFTDNRYSRGHSWKFDGGTTVKASSSPHVTPAGCADESAVDPEEAFVAALASCHMLWFLFMAAKQGYCVESYRDEAVGVMATGANGKLCITSVTLRPHTVFTPAKPPTSETVNALHEEAHAECFIANSVRTELTTVPTFEVSSAAQGQIRD